MRRIVAIGLFVLLLVILGVEAVYSAPIDFGGKKVEYYTWNGFVPVKDAFQRIAAVFGSDDYKGLFFVIAVAAILFGGMSAYVRLLTGVRGSAFGWTYPILMGVIVYLVFLRPSWKVYIYDPVLNRNAVVSNVPMGIAVPAGLLNYVERGIKDIVEGATTNPLSYELNAGGVGVDVLLHAIKYGLEPGSSGDAYLNRTITKFVQECVFFEIARPGSEIDVNNLKSDSVNFLTDVFRKSQNPSVFTVIYTRDDPNGYVASCTNAYQHINSAIGQDNQWNDTLLQLCRNVGIDTVNLQDCRRAVENGLKWLDQDGLWGLTAQGFLRQIYLGKMFADAAAQAAPGYEISLTKSTESGVMWITFNQWIPVVRAVVTAISLSAIPFLVLFVVTPLFGRALSLIFGMMIWVTVFGVMDMLMHQVAVDMGLNVLEVVRARKLGLDALFYLPDSGTKALAMFGYMRGAGMLFATLITGMLVKFGSYALTTLSGTVMGRVESSTSHAAHTTLTPEAPHTAIKREATAVYMGTGFAQGYDPREWMKAGAVADGVGLATRTLTTQQLIDKTGGITSLVGAQTSANVVGELGRFGSTAMQQRIANTLFGGDVSAFRKWQEGGSVIDKELAEKFRKMGFSGVQEGMKLINAGYDKAGNLAFGVFELQDGTHGVVYRDGMVSETIDIEDPITGQRLRGTTVTDPTTKETIIARAEGILSREKEFSYNGIGFKAQAGSEVIKTGDLTTIRGQFKDAQGRLYSGAMVLDAKGNVVEASMVSGVGADQKEGARQHIITSNIDQQLEYARMAEAAGATNVANFIRSNLGRSMSFDIGGDLKGGTATISVSTGGRSEEFNYDHRVHGKNYEELKKSTANIVLNPKDTQDRQRMQDIVTALKEAKLDNAARDIEKAIKRGEAVYFNITSDPNTGRIATVQTSTGAEFSSKDFSSHTKGWERITKAVSKGEFGDTETVYHGYRTDLYGNKTTVGNDVWDILHGKKGIIKERYSDMFGPAPNRQLAEVFMDEATGAFQQYFRQLFEHMKQKGANFSVGANTLLGNVFGVGGNLSLGDVKRLAENANVVRNKLHDYYNSLFNKGLSKDQQMELFERHLSEMFQEGRKFYLDEKRKSELPPVPSEVELPDQEQ